MFCLFFAGYLTHFTLLNTARWFNKPDQTIFHKHSWPFWGTIYTFFLVSPSIHLSRWHFKYSYYFLIAQAAMVLVDLTLVLQSGHRLDLLRTWSTQDWQKEACRHGSRPTADGRCLCCCWLLLCLQALWLSPAAGALRRRKQMSHLLDRYQVSFSFALQEY